jgi:hypothetical protein
MASRGTQEGADSSVTSIMSSTVISSDASMQWLAGAYPVESMLMPRQEYRPFGFDQDEPGPEDLA